jgi:hypothetical protein
MRPKPLCWKPQTQIKRRCGCAKGALSRHTNKKSEIMKIEKSNAQAQRPARKTLTLFKRLPTAEARRVAYEAALAVIG